MNKEQIENLIGNNDPAFDHGEIPKDDGSNLEDYYGSSINIKNTLIVALLSGIGIAVYEVLSKG